MKKEIHGYTIKVDFDEYPDDPRSWDNLGTMVCFHNRYDLGDKHDYDCDDYDGWDEMKNDIIKNENVCVILPLYLYDHSGITMNTSPFHCPWDSGQVGWIFVSKDKVREEYNVKKISSKLKSKIETYLEGEVETYDKFISGQVYDFTITDNSGNIVDSCGGFYDVDECMTEAEGIVEHLWTERNCVVID